MFHFHKYQIVQSQKGYGDIFDNTILEKTGNSIPITILMKKCLKCGKIKTENLEGHWDFFCDCIPKSYTEYGGKFSHVCNKRLKWGK